MAPNLTGWAPSASSDPLPQRLGLLQDGDYAFVGAEPSHIVGFVPTNPGYDPGRTSNYAMPLYRICSGA